MKNRYFLLFTILFITLLNNSVLSQECLPNIGFESDTKTPWQCLEGSDLAGADGTTYTVTLNAGQCLNPNGDNAPFSATGKAADQHVITSGTGTDPYSGLPVVCPTGGKYSVRIGDDFGGGATDGNALAEGISYSFTVTEQNAGLTYMYSAVLCEFTSTGRQHKNNEAPRFEVVITDEATKQQIDCGYYVVNANDYKLPGGGNLLPGKVETSQRWWYTKWTTVNLNLRRYITKRLKIEFRVTDCSPVSLAGNPKFGDHGGYAYIDMKCEPAIITSPIICADTKSVEICAPDGYIAYDWVQLNKITGTMVPPLNGKCITINNPKPGEIYKVNLKTYGGCNTDMIDTLKGFTLKAEKNQTLCPNTVKTFDLNAIPNIENETKYVWKSIPSGFNSTLKNPTGVSTPNTETKYIVTATDKFGCTATDTVTIKISCDIGVTIDPSEICEGACSTIEAKPTGGLGTINYKWNPSPNPGNDNNKGPFKVCPKQTTIYTVTITDAQGKTATDTAIVKVNPKPKIQIRDTLICIGSSVVLTATGAVKYTWITNNTPSDLSTTTGATVTANPKATSTYTIIGESAKGCIDTTKVTVVVNTLPILKVDPKAICKGDSAVLHVTGAITYVWTSPNTPFDLSSTTGATVIAKPNATTTYTIVGELAKGCIGNTTVKVTVNNPPVIDAGPDKIICPGDSAQLQASGGVTYKWTGTGIKNPTLANPWVVTPVTSIYKVVGTDANGCVNKDSVKVTVNPPVKITVGPGGDICKGDSIGMVVYGEPGYTYLWERADGLSSTTSTNPKASPALSTTYTVTGSNGLCPPDKKTVTINVNPIPVAKFTLDKYQGCIPLEVNFGNMSADALGSTCYWDFGDPSSGAANKITTNGLTPVSHKYATVGVFSIKLIVVSAAGCSDTLIRKDTVRTYPLAVADFTFSPEQADIWKPSITYFDKSTNGDILKWYLNTDTNKIISTKQEFTKIYPEAGTFTMCLSVVTVHGCPDKICKPVTITPDWSFFIPNAFTPNADGKNEKFNGVGVNVIEYRMDIFDRWGLHICTINKIDTQDDRGNGWDGTVDGGSGEKQQEDSYVYKVQLTDIFNKKHYYVGRVTLIK